MRVGGWWGGIGKELGVRLKVRWVRMSAGVGVWVWDMGWVRLTAGGVRFGLGLEWGAARVGVVWDGGVSYALNRLIRVMGIADTVSGGLFPEIPSIDFATDGGSKDSMVCLNRLAGRPG